MRFHLLRGHRRGLTDRNKISSEFIWDMHEVEVFPECIKMLRFDASHGQLFTAESAKHREGTGVNAVRNNGARSARKFFYAFDAEVGVPWPEILAPTEFRYSHKATTSGSMAAFFIMVWPSAKTAAITMASVPVWLTHLKV